ncbi:MAG TPA: M28 family peptidase [Gemmatimonadaceae bacterium]|nr:M28 family peptidase [Gemmatimonadaceae bacterium]
MRRSSALLILAFTAACSRGASAPPAGPAPEPPPGGDTAASPSADRTISADALRNDLVIFAADSLRGREAGTAASLAAARFLVSRLTELGLQPGGDSGFYQRVPVRQQRLGTATSFRVTTPRGEVALAAGRDVVPLLSLGPGAPLPRLSAEGDVVFAGYGTQISELQRDDLAGLELRGKTVVVIHGAPPGLDSARVAELTSPNMLGQRLAVVTQRGAAAVVLLLTGPAARDFDAIAAQMMSGAMTLADSATTDDTDAPRPLPLVMIGLPRAGSPLLPAGWPADDKPQTLRGHRFRGNVDLQRGQQFTYNVVAIIPGSDATLSKTYVAFGAHLDHIGIQPPVSGDSIANGADDDGSGSVGLLAIARAIAARPAKRSTLFVWHTAEEQGLLGSQYFIEHSTVPRDSIVAQLNADMIGRNHPDSIYIVGPMAAPNNQSRALGAIVDSVNAASTRRFLVNREWDSPTHPEQIYFRSDHYNYAKHGIPIIFFTTGLHDDYHKVSDEVSKIDFDKLANVAALMRDVGLAVGNSAARPVRR